MSGASIVEYDTQQVFYPVQLVFGLLLTKA